MQLPWRTASLSINVKTTIFLTGNETIGTQPRNSKSISIEEFKNLNDYMNFFLENEGDLLICSPSLKFFCGFDAIKEKDIYQESKFAGFITVADITSKANVINF